MISLPQHLAEFVRAGLTPYEALATATRNAAQYFGILDSSGTVAIGKRADLVLLQSNPLQDVWHTSEPVGVMIGERWLPQEVFKRQGIRPSTSYWRYVADMALKEVEKMLAGLSRQQFDPRQVAQAIAETLGTTARTPAGHQRVLELMARRLGEVRAQLSPAQQASFDTEARAWTARSGVQVPLPKEP